MVFVYSVTQRNGAQHQVLLDDDSPAIAKTICASKVKKTFYFYLQHNGRLTGLARFLMEDKLVKSNDCVDHIDRDTSNNQLSNLRIVSRQQNNCNVGKRSSNTIGMIGVVKNRKKNQKPFYAKITQCGQQHHLGAYNTCEEAAAAYDRACYNIRGDLAVLNNVDNIFKNRLNIM